MRARGTLKPCVFQARNGDRTRRGPGGYRSIGYLACGLKSRAWQPKVGTRALSCDIDVGRPLRRAAPQGTAQALPALQGFDAPEEGGPGVDPGAEVA